MLDMHTHIIPSIDDGSKNLKETIQIIKEGADSGIHTIVATPHYLEGKYENTKENILIRVEYLNEYLKNSGINVSIVGGSEILVCPDIIELLKSGKLCTLNGSRYILIEFAVNLRNTKACQIIKQIIDEGYIPIIAHPERYIYVQKNIKDVFKYVEAGALIQMNIGSLIGDYGEEARETAVKLLKHNLIHTWGSDTHYIRRIYERLQEGLDELKRIVGEDMFKLIIDINPNHIYNNEDIEILDIKY